MRSPAKQSFTTGPHELLGMIDARQDIVIVDVRFPTDYRKGHIPGAVNLPMEGGFAAWEANGYPVAAPQAKAEAAAA